jgi:hypothetical protein
MTREELIEERAKELRLMRFEYNTTEMLTKWENLYSVFKNVYIAKAQEQVDWFIPRITAIVGSQFVEAKRPECYDGNRPRAKALNDYESINGGKLYRRINV